MGAEAGRLLCGIAYHSVCSYHLVSQNFSKRQVLYVPSCHRVPEPPLRGYFSDTDLLPGTGKLPLTVYGCVARWSSRAAHGADRFGKNSTVEDDFPAALLGHVRQRIYAGHQQSRRAENPLCRQQSRPSEHLRGGSRTVQLPYREAHQQERDVEVVSYHRRASDDIFQGAGQPYRHRTKQQGCRMSGISGFQPVGA